jgi:hypothetical protein
MVGLLATHEQRSAVKVQCSEKCNVVMYWGCVLISKKRK